MNNIKWEDGVVCYAGGRQWKSIGDDAEYLYWDVKTSTSVFGGSEEIKDVLKHSDFQLNEIRQGDELEMDSLDCYIESIAVLKLFGFNSTENHKGWNPENTNPITVFNHGYCHSKHSSPRKITYSQLMAIGKLKRAMLERDKSNYPEFPESSKRNKSKQAYEILKSLDYDYDLVKQKWFKKEWV